MTSDLIEEAVRRTGGHRDDGPRDVMLVPHTHWDREWYRPFQAFRIALVEMIDRVLDQLEAEPRFTFTLDGQLATIDDYLEIRPEAEERVRRFVAEGRLAIGPWLILMDEYLVEAETIIRNLRRGWRRAEELGARPMAIGYLPDMFGHVAQMPQLLRRAGIDHAVVWRGVPAAIDHHRFTWVAPDGSAVLAEYLPEGYGNGVPLVELADPGRVAARLEELAARLEPFFGDDPLLTMYGTDHTTPVADLLARVDAINVHQDGWRIQVGTMPDYLARVAPSGLVARGSDGANLETWPGELRASARANVLMGVTSARIDLKVAMARAERLLVRYAEPLAALWGGSEHSERYLDLAWRRVIECSAHDSIGGCSADEVIDQVLVRIGEAAQIAGELADRAAIVAGRDVAADDMVVLNPSARPREAAVELRAPVPESWTSVAVELADGRRVGTQELAREPRILAEDAIAAEHLDGFLLRIHGAELFGRFVRAWRIEQPAVAGGPAPTLVIEVDEDPTPGRFEPVELRRALEAALAVAGGATTWTVRVIAPPNRRLAAVVPVPALGRSAIHLVEGPAEVSGQVRATETSLANDRLAVLVDRDGTFRLERRGRAGQDPGGVVRGAGRLVDEGDFGDTYNWGPPRHDTAVAAPEDVRIDVVEPGPVRAILGVQRRYRWPIAVRPDGSAREAATIEVPVTTRLELRAGEAFARVHLAFENPCQDHRLRFVVPLPRPARRSHAGGQFAVVDRGLAAEAGHGEWGLATFPASGFVDAGGVAVLLPQVMEYELIDDGTALALTVLRATRYLSRDANPYRRDPAGPQIEIRGAQCQGPWEISFAIYPHAGSWEDADVPGMAEEYLHPFIVGAGTAAAGTPLPASLGRLSVEGPGIRLAAARREGSLLELRLVNESRTPRGAVVRGAFRAAQEADLLLRPGAPIEVEEGVLRLQLAAAEIRTVLLDMEPPERGARVSQQPAAATWFRP